MSRNMKVMVWRTAWQQVVHVVQQVVMKSNRSFHEKTDAGVLIFVKLKKYVSCEYYQLSG